MDTVYPLQAATFSGSLASWVGRFQQPQSDVSFKVSGLRDGTPLAMDAKASFPRESLRSPQLPRLWARARVDALLEKIERDGEDQATIDEIIRLARQYKFVTPYTSFLAVPRALLRPRVIRPGDPVLRVQDRRVDRLGHRTVSLRTGSAAAHLSSEDIWQTRFLAPTDMQDGTYTVRLILRDRVGHTYREAKTFVIASKPPVVKSSSIASAFSAARRIDLKVSASQSTRTLVARLDGAAPVELRWDAESCRQYRRFHDPRAKQSPACTS